MPKPPKIIVTGDRGIDRKLRALGPKVARKVVVAAMRRVLKSRIAPEVKADAPKVSGDLAGSVKVRAARRSRKGPGMLVVIEDSSFKAPKYYAAFRQFGTKRMKRDDFMKRAFDAKGPGAVDETMKAIRDGIAAEAAK